MSLKLKDIPAEARPILESARLEICMLLDEYSQRVTSEVLIAILAQCAADTTFVAKKDRNTMRDILMQNFDHAMNDVIVSNDTAGRA